MRPKLNALAVAVLMLASTSAAFAQSRPQLHILKAEADLIAETL